MIINCDFIYIIIVTGIIYQLMLGILSGLFANINGPEVVKAPYFSSFE